VPSQQAIAVHNNQEASKAASRRNAAEVTKAGATETMFQGRQAHRAVSQEVTLLLPSQEAIQPLHAAVIVTVVQVMAATAVVAQATQAEVAEVVVVTQAVEVAAEDANIKFKIF
jgi:hypothetical protein